jgi:hypothetical protein
MASSYSTDLKLELMVTGEDSGTWGDKTNQNWNLISQAVTGYQSISLTSTTTTFAMTNATISNARNMVLELTGTLTGNSTVQLPSGIEKVYFVKDSTTHAGYTLTFKVASGTGFNLTSGKIYGAYSDGTNMTSIDLNSLGGTMTIDQVLTYGSTTTQSLTVGSLTATSAISTNTLLATTATTTTLTATTLTGTTISSNTLTGSTTNDSKGEVRLVPVNTQSGAYTLIATDHGTCISTSSNVIVPSNIFLSGQNIAIFNNGTTDITITQGSGVTMYQVGTSTTGNRTLALKGLATVFCVSTNTFVITGGGIS